MSSSEGHIKQGLNAFIRFSKRFWFIYLLVLVILAFRSSCYESYRIPSHSMTPTLINGDYIVVDKMAYGFRLPFSELADPIYPFGFAAPKRGDVIVFQFPKDRSVSYVKRVVGLPGDTIEIKNKRLILNSVPIEQISVEQAGKGYFKKVTEILGMERFSVQYDKNNYYKVNHKKTVVPKGSYFVMGDNRDYSYDSRFWGLVPAKLVEGKVTMIWLSLIMPSAGESFIYRPSRAFVEL